MKKLSMFTIVAAFVVYGCTQYGIKKRAPTPFGPPALHNAAAKGNLSKIRAILNAGAWVNALHPSKTFIPYLNRNRFDSPVLIATREGQAESVKLLLELGRGADASVADRDGVTPLHLAAKLGNIEIAKILLEHGANPNARNRGKDVNANAVTPLHFAVVSRAMEITKILIEHGAGINARTTGGSTPLTLAIFNDDVEMAKLLIKSGKADVDMPALNDIRPLSFAINRKNIKIVKTLLEHGADPNPHLLKAIINDQTEVAILLIELGNADTSIVERDGTSLLHLAARRGNIEAAKVLLKHGANPNAEDRKGRIPLETAMGLERNQFVKYFGFEHLTEEHAKRIKTKLQIKKSCPNGVEPFSNLYSNSAKGANISDKCFHFSGEFFEFLTESTALYVLGTEVFHLDFHDNPVPTYSHDPIHIGNFSDFVGIVRSEGAFNYVSSRGFKENISNLKVLFRNK